MGTDNITISQDDLKVMLKETFIEVLRERKDLLEDAVIEAIEDIGLARAINEGLKTHSVSEDELFKALDDVRCLSITRRLFSGT